MSCTGDRACAWPVVKDGLCAKHLVDLIEQRSMTGSTMALFNNLETYNWKAQYGSISRKAAAQ